MNSEPDKSPIIQEAHSKRSWIVIFAVCVLGLIGTGSLWLVQRLAVGTSRHALNYQEHSKDVFTQYVRAGCSGVNNGKIWILEHDPRFVADRMATSDQVYRYVVLDGAVLDDPTCLAQVTNAARRVSYAISIAFSKGDGKVAYFYFPAKDN